MINRTSWPSSSRAAACSSACSTTAPQNDQENGTTIPTFTGRTLTIARVEAVRLDGIHHVTAITADAPHNVDFYAGTLGLRLVKKTVNQDDPTVYHLFYADELGSAGADITFFEYPGARRGRAGAGMVHRVVWRVASADALDFWEQRLRSQGVAVSHEEGRLRFSDPEGLGLELAVVETRDEPRGARPP